MSSGNLILGDDELDRVCVVGVGDGMLQDTNCSNDFADTTDFSREIRGISHDDFSLCRFIDGADTDGQTVFIDDFIDLFVEHIRPTENSGKSILAQVKRVGVPSKSLRQLA